MASPKRKNPKSTAVSYYDSGSDTYPDVASATPFPVTIVSGSSSGTEYTEDAAAAANPAGGAVILVRQDTPATLVSADGDNVAQRGTNYGAAYTQIVSSTGAFVDTFGGGTQYTQGDTDASITGTAMLMEVAADTLQPVQGTVADGILVNLGANNDVTVASLPLPSGASTAANQSTIIGHVDGIETLLGTIDADTSTLAGAVSGTEMQVDVLTMPTVTVQATNLDIRDLTSVSDSVSAVVTSSALPTGASTAANQTTIIGHLDGVEGLLTTIDSDTSTLAVVGGGTEATAQRVTIASDSTGVLSVDDNGSSLTVDNAALSVTGGGVEASAMRVTIASDSTGVLSIDDNGGSITIDGTVAATIAAGATTIAKAEDVASADADVGVPAMAVRKATPANTSGTDGDYEMLQMSAGRLWASATVDAALPAGTNTIGGTVPNASASGTGLSVSKTDAQTATVTAVKAGSGRVYGYHIYNPNAFPAFFHFYNIASGSVTVGTSTRTMTLWIPGEGAIDGLFAIPISFDTAISQAATTTITGSTAPAIGLLVDVFYI